MMTAVVRKPATPIKKVRVSWMGAWPECSDPNHVFHCDCISALAVLDESASCDAVENFSGAAQ